MSNCSDQGGRRSLFRALGVHGWPIWELPSSLVGSLLLVETTALALMIMLVVSTQPPGPVDYGFAALLAGMAITFSEFTAHVGRIRWRIGPPLYVDLTSVWTFPAAVVLPPPLAGAVAVIVLTWIWARVERPHRPLYRHNFSTATVVLACLAASAVVRDSGATSSGLSDVGVLAVAMGLLAYLTVNTTLVGGAIALSSPQPSVAGSIGDWDDNLFEIATLCLGALVAAALSSNPLLVALALPPLLLLHRAGLVRSLEEAASTDCKTGLLNAAAWHAQAERELRRAVRNAGPRAVLVLDLDHFKAVNDSHGHVAGDHVLAAVADALRAEVRDRDLVGRFGGEEFVVLLAGLEGSGDLELEAVAERIRRRIADLRVEIGTADGPLTIAGLTVSIGGAIAPGQGGDLGTLMQIADAALYSAKRAGRNVVRMGLSLPAQQVTATGEPVQEIIR